MASDWEISRATGKCVTTGRELAEGEFYYTALFENPQGFERRDYSLEGWTGPPEDSFCHWKTRMPVRGKKPSVIAVDSALLVTLFNRLEEDTSEMRQKFRYVLALLLMRKRLLRFERSVREDDREFWHMRLLADQSQHRILNPQLSPEEIERLSAELTAILSGDASAISAIENGEASTSESAADCEAAADSEPVNAAPELPELSPGEDPDLAEMPQENPCANEKE